MNKEKRKKILIIMILILAVLLVGIVFSSPHSVKHETVKEAMRDAVLHEDNKVSFFGLAVDPSDRKSVV